MSLCSILCFVIVHATASAKPLPKRSKHNNIMLGMFYDIYHDMCTLVSGCSVYMCIFVPHALFGTYYNTTSTAGVAVKFQAC